MRRRSLLTIAAALCLAGGLILLGVIVYLIDQTYGENWLYRFYAAAYTNAGEASRIYFLLVEYQPGVVEVNSDALTEDHCNAALEVAPQYFPGAMSLYCWPVLDAGTGV